MTKNKSIFFSFRQFFRLVAILNLGANLCWAAGALPIQSTDFASLYNQHRVGQATPVPWAGSYFPYGYDGTAAAINSRGELLSGEATPSTPSPMMEYERVFSTSKAHEWEKNNHTCSKIKNATEKAGCEGWWGHCNGWSAAAIKEQEPVKPLQINGGSLSVAAQKGILTEYWLESSTYFEGATDKSRKTGKWIANVSDPDYQAFWDVTPRQFFLLVTNYLGIQKTGVVVDRFTGEQVWNQPLVGYRVLPVDTSSMKAIQTASGKTMYRYLFGMKIYWANDGVEPGHKSKKFSVAEMSDRGNDDDLRLEHQRMSPDYEVRLLKFYLSFDSPLRVSSNGETLANNPRMIGDGFWFEQQEFIDRPGQVVQWEEYNQSHPDFVWMPISGFETGNGYRNPMLQGRHVEAISRTLASGAPASPSPADPATPSQPSHPHSSGESSEFKVVVLRTDEMKNLDEAAILAKIKEFFARAGTAASILDFQVNGMSVRFEAEVSGGLTPDSLKNLLTESGFRVLNVENK